MQHPRTLFCMERELSACSAPASAAEKRRSEAVFDGFLPVGLRRAPRCKTCGCAGEPVLQPKRAGRAFQHFRKAAGQRLVAAEVHQPFRIMKLMDGGMAFVVIVHTELCCVKIKLRAGSCADKARAAPPGVVFYKKCLMV